MKFTALATALMATSFANAYLITGDKVNCRTGPGTTYAVKQVYNKGTNVVLTCQTTGTVVNGNKIWDKTTAGCYVSDYYVKTGSSGFVTTICGSTSTPSGTYCKTLNTAGMNLITAWEGFVAKPSPDPIGLPTVGYGHLCQQKNCAEVKYKFPLTKATARQLLNDDIPKYTKCLAAMLNSKVKLNDNQWAALTSWVFNNGCGQTATSSLIRRLNKGESPNLVAGQELPKWKYAGGKVLQGLVNRRNAEIKLFKTASSKQGYPKCG